MELISIIIPFYNKLDYLDECLYSLQMQTYENWEAIVVDDGSTQRNLATLLDMIGDQRISLVRHDRNLGLSAARNTGFKLARSQLVVSLDADDKFDPTYLQKLNSALFEHPDVDCVFFDIQLFGASTKIWHYKVCDAEAMTRYQWIPGSGTLMRRCLWLCVGGYCEAQDLRPGNEDWDFWLSAIATGIKVLHVPEALYLYRQQRDSMVTHLAYTDYQTRKFIYRRHYALFDRYGTGNEFLANGYQNSALAAWQRSEHLRTAYLAAYGWRFSPRRRRLLKLAIKAIIPSFLLPIVQRGWGLFQQFKNIFSQ
jgi:glycosyltransferase involved in cell wall biosynthesis